jgi:hypothetical protein
MKRQTKTDAYNQKLADALDAHDRLDTERFDAVTVALQGIAADVKSLLETRSFTRGVWRAAVIAATVVSTAATLVIEVVKWRVHP